MDKNEIVKAARRLPVESRRLIIEQLRKSIEWDETKDRAEVRLAELIPLACEALGVQEYDPRRKENADTYVRNLCAWAMRREGYSLPRIGHAMVRHPSSVIVMDRRGEEMRRGFFGPELQLKFYDFAKNVHYDEPND